MGQNMPIKLKFRLFLFWEHRGGIKVNMNNWSLISHYRKLILCYKHLVEYHEPQENVNLQNVNIILDINTCAWQKYYCKIYRKKIIIDHNHLGNFSVGESMVLVRHTYCLVYTYESCQFFMFLSTYMYGIHVQYNQAE